MPTSTPSSISDALAADIQRLLPQLVESGPQEAVQLLEAEDDDLVAAALGALNPATAQDILAAFTSERRQLVAAAATPELRRQWAHNETFPEDTIGRIMETPLAVFPPETTIGAAREALRPLVKKALITYLFIVDAQGQMLGIVAMRELFLGRDEQRLEEVMLRNAFHLTPDMPLGDAMKAVVTRHFPIYPVCEGGRLVGTVRGQTLFEAQTFELSAQAGAMVGVEKEERLTTPWPRCLKFRHPWLQLNLLTAFIAAAVVGIFEHTIDRIVVLAVFLPVLAGQSGNTGCQALAVALRGITLGELTPQKARALVGKEALLGFFNGAMVGVTAAGGMYFYASKQNNPAALTLAGIVWVAMIGSCVVSGLSGALIPLTLKRLGADPATASSIFLTTATDVVSMGVFLGLATVLI